MGENLLVTMDLVKIAYFGLAREVHSKSPFIEYVSTRCHFVRGTPLKDPLHWSFFIILSSSTVVACALAPAVDFVCALEPICPSPATQEQVAPSSSSIPVGRKGSIGGYIVLEIHSSNLAPVRVTAVDHRQTIRIWFSGRLLLEPSHIADTVVACALAPAVDFVCALELICPSPTTQEQVAPSSSSIPVGRKGSIGGYIVLEIHSSNLAPVRVTAVDHRQTIRIWVSLDAISFFIKDDHV
ncbi:hypothetical protein ZIOFF_015681 [Zingiber officinale]|uniref:Uncharacterized protein n=1 Tax=Zingiber officinale TaxID=94328 RepID=A0A8J5HFA2_ZINOF|nr:hypothetical protein ZIOFF_015681 [Zingiber officinale]